MVWPGLNTTDMRDKKVIKMEEQPPKPMRQEELDKMREQKGYGGRPKILALQRGWSGNRYPGMSMGPPDPVGECRYRPHAVWSMFD